MPVSDTPPTLEQVLSGTERSETERALEAKIPGLRLQALKASAMSYGTQAGFARRNYEIEQTVQGRTGELNRIYDFCGLMLDRNVVPPVLVESRNTLQATGSDLLRISDATFQIVAQAHFSTACPSWRDYLIRSATFRADGVEIALTPRDDAERRYWQTQVAAGWKVGVDQADQVFAANLARLERDYKGMVLYRSLLTRKMVSKPYVAQSDLGVTGDGTKISINDRILRITALPQLDVRSEKWIAPVVPRSPNPGEQAGSEQAQ